MRNKFIAAGLALIFGLFGIHKFYLGKTGWGIVYIIVTLLGFWNIIGFICIIEAIFYLVVNKKVFDENYNPHPIICEECGEKYPSDLRKCIFCGFHNKR